MSTRSLLLLSVLCAIPVGVATAAAEPQSSPRRIEVPPVPANLELPSGHEVYLEGQAVGTQNYICLPSGAGAAWKFVGPQATLFLTSRRQRPEQVTTHFLSANPAETGTARPTWLHSEDSSQVWGKAAASSTDPNFVAPGAIPWLLVQAVGRSYGPTGGSELAMTTFIHRVNTSGGVAPATGCTQPGEVGTLALVPYTTDYFFYRAARHR